MATVETHAVKAPAGSGVNAMAERVAVILLASFVATWLAWSLAANLDAADGRHVLFMDELVSYDGIARIQDATTSQELSDSVTGWDQRYGRPLWYVPAFINAPFHHIDDGRAGIVANRIFFSLCLLGSFFVLAIALIDRWIWRAAAIVAAAVTPFAAYFATMPKPEPMQFLFLGIFLWLMFRRGQNLGWSWLLMGLTFGMKIHAVAIIPGLLLLGVMREWGAGGKQLGLKTLASIIALMAGYLIAVPALFTAEGRSEYMRWTWNNTGHYGSDDASVTPVSWLGLMDELGFFGPANHTWIGLLAIIVVALAVLGSVLGKASGERAFSDRLRALAADPRTSLLIVLGTGLVLVAEIVIPVKRLWGHYLYQGAALTLIATFALTERLVASSTKRFGRTAAAALGAFIFAFVYVGGANPTFAEFKRHAHRSDNPQYALSTLQYEEMTATADALQQQLGRPIRVAFDAFLYHPTSTREINYAPLYNLYGNPSTWGTAFDLQFFRPDPAPEALASHGPRYVEDAHVFMSRRESQTSASPDQPCQVAPCYVQIPMTTEGLRAWRLVSTFTEAASAQAETAASAP